MESEALMTDYVWCHGPNCHKRSTTNRVRGVKGSRPEALETPIEVEVETLTDWRGQPYQSKVIKKIDNNSNP
jgi:hypothetical protein